MDSDIGLRSPQDSILARRRREFRRKQQSSHSDSNSCDTPTSENSPRDLTISKPITSEVTAQLPLTPSLVKKSPSPPRTPTILSFKGKFFSKVNTVWNFQDFSITQILREINFGGFRSSKNAVLAILGALKMSILVNFSLQKVQNFKIPSL